MAKNPDAQRRRLFDLYTAQACRFDSPLTDRFVCPLCRDIHDRGSLDGPPLLLDRAHVVPDSLGGNLCTLTCKGCNNDNGAAIEADLLERFRYEDWTAGVGGWPIRMSGAFGEIGASLHIREPGPAAGLSIYAEPKRSDRRVMNALSNGTSPFVGPDGEITWTLRWRMGNRPGRIGAAIFQSAYLMMFAYFGYDFALRDQYEPLRRQILRPDEAIWPGRVFTVPTDEARQLQRREGGVLFVRRPEPCVAVLLRFQPKGGGRERVLGVLLPSPEAGDGRLPLVEPGPFDVSIVEFRPDVLPSRPHYYTDLWRRVQADGR